MDFKRGFLFSFLEGSRGVSLHLLELYNQVRGKNQLLCLASILKRVFTIFRATFVRKRVPSGSTFCMIPPENGTTERVHLGFCTGARISFRFEISQQHRVTKNNHSFRYEIRL